MGHIYIFLKNISFTDIIDIAVVSIIVFRFLLIVQGTRAIQILLGIAALASLYWISLTNELHSINWLLEHFFEHIFVILIVLFQEQFRSALAAIGDMRPFTKHSNREYDLQVEEVVNASAALSRERTGALIVFEKKHGLLNYSKTGTRVDSKIHSDILYSIFQSNSPLHDGAVILFKSRIQAAGCFLPLSKNVEIDRHLGTRHRAALGISEVSDAVVVVVSEETGRISLCYKGEFYYMEEENSLRRFLKRFLAEEENVLVSREAKA